MKNKFIILRLIFILVFISLCIYFYKTNFYERQVKQIVVLLDVTENAAIMTTPLTTRKTLTTLKKPKKNVDLFDLAEDLREYALTRREDLERKLFPWWFNRRIDKTSKQSHYESDTSKGIVICTGNNHFRLTLIGLEALQLIGNELPIEVVYSTSTDLSQENRQKLQKLYPNVELIDLSLAAFNDSYLELRGWEIKPFAVLASRYRHVLLIDADVLFVEKPSILFENSLYLKTGTLFFYDRVTLGNENIRWIRDLSVDNKNQMIPPRTQESGVVLIDKARTLVGLLSTCKLNDHHERERVTYRRLYGDKDTWWIGFHIIQMPYSFIPTLTASIGQITNTANRNVVCGHILHLDENYRPIWWNGGLFRNRYFSTTSLLPIEGWLVEGQWTLSQTSCLTNMGQTAKQFSKHQQDLINGYTQITRRVYDIK